VAAQPSNESGGPLPGHVRRGRVFTPPLLASTNVILGDWTRRDAPDLLWPIVVFGEDGTSAAKRFVDFQASVIGSLGDDVAPALLAQGLDGRLTSIEALCGEDVDRQQAVRGHAERHGLLSTVVQDALAISPHRPAAWLTPDGPETVSQPGVDLLVRAFMAVHGDGHREALIKCLSIWARVQTRTFSSDQRARALLVPYPHAAATRSQADTFIRASWGAHEALIAGANPALEGRRAEWTTSFWIYSSGATRCMRKRELVGQDDAPDDVTPPQEGVEVEADVNETAEDGSHLQQFAMDIMSSYVEALESSPTHLAEREFQEVHSGLVSRAARDVIVALGSPDFWCAEHGSHITRMLVETRISLTWMDRQEGYGIYREFQEYGAGKAKLYARIMKEVPVEARQPGFQESVDELEKLSHNGFLDYRVVDTRDSFAGGKSIRAMAEEVGLLDFYRQSYALASGVAHSEWWSVENHAMERCMNILHGGHLIPSLSLNSGASVPLASAWADMLYALIRYSLREMRVWEPAVNEAFGWLEAPTDPDPPQD
jgi:hypothetical protein